MRHTLIGVAPATAVMVFAFVTAQAISGNSEIASIVAIVVGFAYVCALGLRLLWLIRHGRA